MERKDGLRRACVVLSFVFANPAVFARTAGSKAAFGGWRRLSNPLYDQWRLSSWRGLDRVENHGERKTLAQGPPTSQFVITVVP